MSLSNALQQALFERLTTYAPLVALVGTRVADQPQMDLAPPYITFGASDFIQTDVDCIDGQSETIILDVWSVAQDGKRECKAICAAIVDALRRYEVDLPSGALADLRIDLVRVLDDPDGRTTHGVVQVTADLEEPV
jgi:hypothetical protein